MRILHLSSLLVLISSVLADVTYNVIGFPDAETNTYAVEINGELYPLQTSKELFPLWSTRVDGVSTPSSYRYVQLNHKNKAVAREEFLRNLADKNTTPNEFFNRETTLTTLPAIKQVYKDVRPMDTGVFDVSQIATIHLTVDPAKFDDMMNNPMDQERKGIKAGFRFINANKTYSADMVKIKISGHGSRKFRKVSLHVKFKKNKGGLFFDRSAIKLRAEYVDPSMIREKLYLDLLNSVGVGSSQGSYSRVYVNGKPHGLYLMVEDIEESMLMHTIHHGAIKDKKALGSLYQMGTAVEFKGPRTADYKQNLYKNIIRGDNPKDEPMQQFIAFMKDLQDWDPTDTEGIAFWNQRLDLDGFLRSMALEYLTGAFDSSWWSAHNYYMYYNPQLKVWQFIPMDFDHSFSAGDRLNINETYKEYAQTCEGPNPKSRPLVTKLICKNKDINKKFETILLTITHDVFNNAALKKRVHAYERQLDQEVAWDYSIDRSILPGTKLNTDITHFHKSIRGPFKTVHKGILPWIKNRSKSVTHHFAK
ncbi:MAG: coth protein-domain-containing protein [Podila humilis]|nr:MAG: coth protein-domain-containing protein [Podila humilis]